MPWRNIVGLALAALLALALRAGAEEPRPTPAAEPPASQSTARIAEGQTCPGECQARHDQCRVQTKGSPSCDAERQACLQKCITKKKK
ncbi:MAG: hypothetical protein JSS20_20875 [Proteobacteria bacterium]|nr:hypothetical protein [Pseudomonadota bacterium]